MRFNTKVSLAIATAMALGGSVAQAASLNFDVGSAEQSHSLQGLVGIVADQAMGDVVVTLNADYTINDTVNLVYAGGAPGTATPVFACEDGPDVNATPDLVISYVTRSGNTLTYRVTQKEVVDVTGLACTLTGINVTGPSLDALAAGGEASLTYSALTAVSNLPLDSEVTNTIVLANVFDQFTTNGVVAFNGVVDVNNARKVFVGDDVDANAGDGDTADTLTVVLNNNQDAVGSCAAGTATCNNATLNVTTVLVNGDFTFTDLDGDGCGDDALGGTLTQTGGTSVAVAANCQSATITGAAGATYTLTATGTAAGKIITAPQTFTSSVTYAYDPVIATAPDQSETDTITPGAWTLNGFSAFIPYMPYGANISQIVYLTNKSTQTGAVTVVGYNEAGTACSFSAGTVGASRVTSLAGVIKTGVEGCYGAGFTGKVSITVTANIPGSTAEIYSAYNVGGSDRGTVINNSNGRVTQGGDSTLGGGL
jgi:hypothetical protein